MAAVASGGSLALIFCNLKTPELDMDAAAESVVNGFVSIGWYSSGIRPELYYRSEKRQRWSQAAEGGYNAASLTASKPATL